ncbi:hypothetical protein TUM17384_00290 [Shewanella algae]|nr:hypothetical protein TUM17382_00300 [Shewanella algae]BCV56084.1 hypothetical protein TUM17384_00290 [Shewanella algae]
MSSAIYAGSHTTAYADVQGIQFGAPLPGERQTGAAGIAAADHGQRGSQQGFNLSFDEQNRRKIWDMFQQWRVKGIVGAD